MSGDDLGGSDSWELFPAGLKVLVVDDDPLCLKVVEHMLRRCNYQGELATLSPRLGSEPLVASGHRATACDVPVLSVVTLGYWQSESLVVDPNYCCPVTRSDDLPQWQGRFGEIARQVGPLRSCTLRRLYAWCACSFLRFCCQLAVDGLGYRYVILSCWMSTDMDGFKLLEHIGLELDLPVISKHSLSNVHSS